MEVCRPAGPQIVLEPLNPKDHAGSFFSKIPQAYEISGGSTTSASRF